MQDFENRDVQDEDGVEITDLDPQGESSSTSLSLVLLRFVRKTPFLANTRAIDTTLALLICVIVLLFLVQPGVPSIPRRASSAPVLATASSSTIRCLTSVLRIVVANKETWYKAPDGIVLVRQASDGSSLWQYFKLQRVFVTGQDSHPVLQICK
jgi:hypothetical protein